MRPNPGLIRRCTSKEYYARNRLVKRIARDREKLPRQLYRGGTARHGPVSRGTSAAKGEYAQFPFSRFRWKRSHKRIALRCLQDLREGMSAAMHLYCPGTRREGEAAKASPGL